MAGLLNNEWSFLGDPEYWNLAKNRALGLLDNPVTRFVAKTAESNRAAGERLANKLVDPAEIASLGRIPIDAMTGSDWTPKQQLRDDYDKAMMYAGLAPIGMTVWHGSPHKFSKFDMSKIGTGEGAQAYGHGLYMAETPEVAQTYQKQISGDGFLVGDKVFDPWQLKHMNLRSMTARGDLDGAIAKAKKISVSDSPVADKAAHDLAILEDIKAKGGLKENQGALYKVDIPDEAVARFLDWDKPVAEELRKPVSEAAMKQWESGLSGTSGEHLYNEVVKNFEWAGSKSPKDDAIKWLNQQGIPGIRYLDGGSRSAGQGSSNFVLFDDQLPRILETNGVPTGQVPWKPGEWGGLLGKTEPVARNPLIPDTSVKALPEPQSWYHGSPADIYGSKEGWFKPVAGESGVPAVWGVRDPFSAEGYARGGMKFTPDANGKYPLEWSSYKEDGMGGGVYSLIDNSKNPFVHDAGGKDWVFVPQGRIMREAKAAGHDSVVFKNIADNYDNSGITSDVIAWFDPSVISKARGAVDSGIIPWLMGAGLLGGYGVNQAQE